MSKSKRVLSWFYRNKNYFIAAGVMAILVSGLVFGDWFTRFLILMTLFFFFIAWNF